MQHNKWIRRSSVIALAALLIVVGFVSPLTTSPAQAQEPICLGFDPPDGTIQAEVAGSTIKVDWNAYYIGGASSFTLMKSTTAMRTDATLVTTYGSLANPVEEPFATTGFGGSTPSYIDSNVTPGVTYYYWLAGTYDDGTPEGCTPPPSYPDNGPAWWLGPASRLMTNPLGVTMNYYRATQVGPTVSIDWETYFELHMRGFYVLRGENPNGSGRVQLNQYMIQAIGSPSGGATYQFVDYGTTPAGPLVHGVTYYYWIHALETTGATEWYGPMTLTYTNPLAVFLTHFDGEVDGNVVYLTWGTASELGNAGFNLWRLDITNSGKEQDPVLVGYFPSPAPGSSQGASYWHKEEVPNGTYHYWLEDVDLNGVVTAHDPIEVVVGDAHTEARNPDWTCTGVTEPVQNANGTWNFTGQGHANFWRAAAYPGYNPVYAGPQTSPIFTSVSLPQGWFEVQAADNSNGPWTVAAACRREIQPPLAVTLADFNADPQGDHVLVTWETGSEINNAGLNLYRGPSGDGDDRTLITNVPSQAPGSTQGAAYSYEDVDVTPGQTYYYWLEAVDLSGATTMHGPVSATMATPTAVTMAGFVAAPGDDNDRPNLGGWLFIALGALTVLGGWSRRHQSAGNSFWLYWRDNN